MIGRARDGGVVTLTFDDPARRNAMTEAMGRALGEQVRDLSRDEGLRCVILTGAGSAFSAGGDLDMIESRARAGVASPGGEVRERHRRFMREFYGLFLSIRDLPCPTVAEQLDTEAWEQALNYESPDLLEGIAAARERRSPRFRGT